MYFIKRDYHIAASATRMVEVREWLREHADVTFWDWLRGRFNGYTVEFVPKG